MYVRRGKEEHKQVISEDFWKPKIWAEEKNGACNHLFFGYCKESGPSRQIETQESVRVHQHNWIGNINSGGLLHAFQIAA